MVSQIVASERVGVVFAVALFVCSYREMPPAVPLLKFEQGFLMKQKLQVPVITEQITVRHSMLESTIKNQSEQLCI